MSGFDIENGIKPGVDPVSSVLLVIMQYSRFRSNVHKVGTITLFDQFRNQI